MTRIKAAGNLLLLLFLLVAAWANLKAQSISSIEPKAAQAKSQIEFDKYLEIVTAKDPQQTITRVDEFASLFPRSELLSPAYQYQMHAFQQMDEFDKMLAAGRKALQGNADDVNTLLALAPAMADRASSQPDRDDSLSQAEVYARHALELIESTRIPRKLSIEQWDEQKRKMQSEAHAVLGTVALQRKRGQDAVSEYKLGIALAPKPQGIHFLRLGLALASVGAKDDAEISFRRAAELGPAVVRSLAMEELERLSKQPAAR